MSQRFKLTIMVGFLLVAGFLVFLSFSPSLFGPGSRQTQKASYQQLQGDFSQQVDRMLAKTGNYQLSLPSKRCHWLRPTHNGTHMLLEIITYNNSETCGGQVIKRKQVVLEKPLSIHGKCVCGTSCHFKAETINNTQYLRQKGCRVQQ